MKKWLFLIALFVLINTGVSPLSAQNTYNQSITNQNAAQSGYHSGQSNTQNKIGFIGNEIVTGNVRSGKQLQGNAPYRSTSNFNANPGTSALSSFMRDSAGSDSLSKYLTNNTSNSTGTNYQSNYLPSQTVTSMSKTGTGVSAYKNSDSEEISQTLADMTERLNALQQKIESGNYNQNTASQNNMQRYMTNSRGNEITSTSELYSGIDENPAGSYLRNNSNRNSYQQDNSPVSGRINKPQYQPENLTGTTLRQPSYDTLEDIRKKLDELSMSIDSHLQTTPENPGQYNTANPPARAEEKFTNFQSYSQSQFDKHFRTAGEQLQLGNYYEAADSFTLASIYEPDNPHCYAGYGHAMFAAGQFVNSALFIIRAIELNPDYIQANIDLVTITGGREFTSGRIAELEQLLKKAPASGLQFLMAYVYYRTGRFIEARQIINAVYQDMSQSRAAIALKIAIDSRLNSQR